MKTSEIGKNIKKCRLNKKLSQEQLAEKVYSTKSTVSKWENGSIVPSVDLLKIIAKELRVSIYELLGEHQPLSSRIVSYIGKFFLWAFVWVHIDITFVGIIIGTSIAMAILGFASGVTNFVLYIIDSNNANDFSGIRIVTIVGSLIWSPFLLFVFGSISLMLYIIGKEVHMFSRKYFWNDRRANFKLNELDVFKKINKKAWIAFFIMSGIGCGYMIGLCTYSGTSSVHWKNFSFNHL